MTSALGVRAVQLRRLRFRLSVRRGGSHQSAR